VSTDVGGVAEVVIDGRTGVLVPPARPDALAAAILRVVGDSQAAREMGRAGRARVELAFDVGAMCRQYETLYLNALDRGRESHAHAVATRTGARGFAPGSIEAAGPSGVQR
jgi:glycosyltransferase involved in cell wall biosynthesis